MSKLTANFKISARTKRLAATLANDDKRHSFRNMMTAAEAIQPYQGRPAKTNKPA